MNRVFSGTSVMVKHRPRVSPRVCAFTLIELVLILALLGLFTLLLPPALARSQTPSNAVRCLNNYRQLGAAWRMYAEDNQGRLAPNHDGSSASSWAGGWIDFTSSSDNTNTELLINHDRYPGTAFLGPYLRNPRPFKCPSDKSTVSIYGQRLPRVRSVSMNGRVGEGARSWTSASQYLLYTNIAVLGGSAASRVIVFVDELEESINDATFFIDPDTAWELIDYPASRHNAGADFGFADGHAEIHRWHDLRTMPVLKPGQLLPFNIPMPGNIDVLWLQQHAAARK